jgi:hypothetical protein
MEWAKGDRGAVRKVVRRERDGCKGMEWSGVGSCVGSSFFLQKSIDLAVSWNSLMVESSNAKTSMFKISSELSQLKILAPHLGNQTCNFRVHQV